MKEGCICLQRLYSFLKINLVHMVSIHKNIYKFVFSVKTFSNQFYEYFIILVKYFELIGTFENS